MSVRAYKLIEVKHAKNPTFNCWHDPEIMDLASNNNLGEGGGELEFHKSELQDALKSALKTKTHTDEEREENEKQINILKQMIKDCGKNDYVVYYCF